MSAGNIFETALSAQRIAQDMGELAVKMRVLGWATKWRDTLPQAAKDELHALLTPANREQELADYHNDMRRDENDDMRDPREFK